MQFYRDGFTPGDPKIVPAPDARSRGPLSADGAIDEVDVLIVGSGPAGNMLAAVLSEYPEIDTRIVERRTERLELGQADGIACRTVETLESFGLAQKLIEEAYWVNELTFWRPDANNRDHIVRTGREQDVEDGLSEFPHVIVNQARIHDYLLDYARDNKARLEPDYGLEFDSLEIDKSADYPVTATLRDVETGETRTVRARYVVGTDGARSGVRKAIGRKLEGDAAGHAWGVMDVLAVSDFPDWRIKSTIQSADKGSILLIPREGGYMVRVYVDLGTIDDSNRSEIRGMTREEMTEVANRVLHPYTIDVKETVWWSIYEVAQRVTDGFDEVAGRAEEGADPRVFIAGDACHTHSAKAGQGLNVSTQDTLNLGWKLAAVLRGIAKPELLETYSSERQPVAQRLVDFDKEWSTMLAAQPRDPEHPELGGVDPAEVQAYFVKAGRFTAGVATQYPEGPLTGSQEHQGLATGFEIGTRFHSAPVTRIGDAKHTELGHVHRADGRWRLYLFADASEQQFTEACNWLTTSADSPLRAQTPAGTDLDALIDVRGIVQRPHREVQLNDLPELMRPQTGRYGLVDPEKAFSAITRDANIYDARGIDRDEGCLVLVRPDQYVSQVLPLDQVSNLAEFFGTFIK